MNKLIINFAPTGLIPTRRQTPHLPISPREIIREVITARVYGVSMVHLHARDQEGNPTHKKEVYEEIICGIRNVDPALVLCASTSGRNWAEFEKRSECLDLTGDAKPDMGSLTLSSLNFNQSASINSPEMIQSLARKMLDKGIKPEMEVFDLGMINYAKYLYTKKLIEPPFYFNLMFGNIAGAQANVLSLGLMLNELPDQSTWCVGGIGDAQLRMNINGMINGGGVRVGLEDNLFYTGKRDRLATNADLLRRIHQIAEILDIEIATADEVRDRLNLRRQGVQ